MRGNGNNNNFAGVVMSHRVGAKTTNDYDNNNNNNRKVVLAQSQKGNDKIFARSTNDNNNEKTLFNRTTITTTTTNNNNNNNKRKQRRILNVLSSAYQSYDNNNNNNNTFGGSKSTSREEERELTQKELWWRCAKVPMYAVAIIPVIVAASAASYLNLVDVNQGMKVMWRLLLGACSIIAWLNISNDAWDYQTGVDAGNKKPESIVNLLNGDVKAALITSAFFLVAGCVTLLPLFANAPIVAPAALLLAIFCGVLYQAPPFRLSYKGLGEPLCFTAFGPLAIPAFFAVFAGANVPTLVNIHPLLWVCSFTVGVTTSMILFSSHLHQREGDEDSGKLSPTVRHGVEFCVTSIQHVVSAYYALIATFVSCGWLPSIAGALVMMTYPLAKQMQSFALENVNDERKLFKTKYLTVRWHIAHGISLSLGLWLSRRLAVPF